MIDRTQTHWGKLALRGIISNPTSDISLLEQRQEIVGFLLAHEDCYAKLRDAFDILAQTQNIVLSFWAQNSSFTNKQSELFFTSLLHFNQRRIKQFDDSFANTITLPTLHTISFKCCKCFSNKHSCGVCGSTFNQQIFTRTIRGTPSSNAGAAGDILATLMCSINNKYIASAGTILTSTYLGLSAKEMFEWTRDCFSLELYLQKKLIVVAQFFKALCDVREIFATHPEFLEKCPPAQALNDHLLPFSKY